MKKDGEEVLLGILLAMDKLKHLIGSDIESKNNTN